MFNQTKGLLKIQGCYTDQQQQKTSDSHLLKNTIKWIKINDIKCFHTQKQFSLKVLPTKAVEDCQVIALRDTQLTMRCKKQKKNTTFYIKRTWTYLHSAIIMQIETASSGLCGHLYYTTQVSTHLSPPSLLAVPGFFASLPGAAAVSGALLNTAWSPSLLDTTSGACSVRVRTPCNHTLEKNTGLKNPVWTPILLPRIPIFIRRTPILIASSFLSTHTFSKKKTFRVKSLVNMHNFIYICLSPKFGEQPNNMRIYMSHSGDYPQQRDTKKSFATH